MVLVIGGSATAIAINVHTVYGLFVLCSDLLYVIIFPQLTCALFVSFTNTYGGVCGFFLGMVFRVAGGESLIGLKPLIHYPYYDDHQYFPYKTFSMLLNFGGIIVGSILARGVFLENALIPLKMDVLKCFYIKPETTLELNSPLKNGQ